MLPIAVFVGARGNIAPFPSIYLRPISRATGSGKAYMACAFGMEACKQRYKTKYIRLTDRYPFLRNMSTFSSE
ncbi:hypothetical protein GPL26_11855 [Enterocloster citroniae]|uniref:IstB-like ATP-binding protein domain-containing protein n=1 Tax=Enterocloster citroniae TaxID=358743 RepID=A0AA41FEN8_9FIRM|nr:hypothetical protein [Enterocloster citroniae]RGC10657.1 hypothetical protein DWZ14_10610 [Enterocloster citroniae]